jgi:small subunit ribosomal protein S18
VARGDRDRDRRRAAKDTARRGKKKVCLFCKEHIDWVDYKDVNLLRRYMSDRGKIRARRVSGNCAQHQREVAVAIKTARELALLPYTQRSVAERAAPRPRREMLAMPVAGVEAVPVEDEEELEEGAAADAFDLEGIGSELPGDLRGGVADAADLSGGADVEQARGADADAEVPRA